MTRCFAATSIFLLTCTPASERQTVPSPNRQFEQTTARGCLLAEYLNAVQSAARANSSARSSAQAGLLYVARKTETGWQVMAGRLNQNQDAFLSNYDAVVNPRDKEVAVQKYEVPMQDVGFYFVAAKAINLVARDFRGQNHLYRSAVLPTGSNGLYVYILPAQTTTGVYLFGGDARYLVSPDGSTVIEKHEMHKSIIEFRESQNGHAPAAGIHSHVLTDVPEDSDVAYVLSRRPSIPEFIKTRDHLFLVEVDGTIVRKQ